MLGQREDLFDLLLGEDRPAGRDPSDHGDVGRGRGVADVGLVEGRLLGARHGATCRHHLGQEHLQGARPVGVAPEEALALEHSSWWATLEDDVRPTALPISRMVGG